MTRQAAFVTALIRRIDTPRWHPALRGPASARATRFPFRGGNPGDRWGLLYLAQIDRHRVLC